MDMNIRKKGNGSDTDTISHPGMLSADSDVRPRCYETRTDISLDSIEERLDKLKAWHAAGLIDTEVWKEKQAQLIQDL
jgi:hypothetical protein